MVRPFLCRKILKFSFPCLTTAPLANLESVKCNESEGKKENRENNLPLCFQNLSPTQFIVISFFKNDKMNRAQSITVQQLRTEG